jgi:hypothetical protein
MLLHALCGVHAERLTHKRIALNERQRLDQERGRAAIGRLSAALTACQRAPDPAAVAGLHARFEAICSQKPSFATLHHILKRLKTHQSALLRVLLRPDSPRHTNGSENAIRGYVQWRKINGGPRSDLGRRGRDTVARLKKTGRKRGSSFWDSLNDRIGQVGDLPPWPEIVRARILAAQAVP